MSNNNPKDDRDFVQTLNDWYFRCLEPEGRWAHCSLGIKIRCEHLRRSIELAKEEIATLEPYAAIPSNANLREEKKSCGKRCSGCPHGPYYVVYWRDDGKLKKEYFPRQLLKYERILPVNPDYVLPSKISLGDSRASPDLVQVNWEMLEGLG
jgi:hypothetical protein